MLSQNICYTLYTKDSVSQSLRSKGTLNSLLRSKHFLDKWAINVEVDNASFEFHLFGINWNERKYAKRVYEKLKNEYGKPPKVKLKIDLGLPEEE